MTTDPKRIMQNNRYISVINEATRAALKIVYQFSYSLYIVLRRI